MVYAIPHLFRIPVGDYGFESTVNSIVELGPGEYMGFFHDNGIFHRGGDRLMEVWHTGEGQDERTKAIWRERSEDGGWKPGGLTWSKPKHLLHDAKAGYMEPGSIKSPDGKQILMMLRSESRHYNSFSMVSNDNGETWSEPVEMPAAVTGDRHYLKYLPDGRIFMTFRDMAFDSPTQGDWMGWIGTYEDLVNQREGQYRIRIMENERHDCGYAGIEILPDGTIVTTSYGSFDFGKPNYVVSVRFKPEELDEKYKEIVG